MSTLVHIFFLTIAALYLTNNAAGFVCPPNPCKGIKCQPPPKCEKGQVLKPGACGCCQMCVTILHEGDKCHAPITVGGGPPTVRCDDGLVCFEGICSSKKGL